MLGQEPYSNLPSVNYDIVPIQALAELLDQELQFWPPLAAISQSNPEIDDPGNTLFGLEDDLAKISIFGDHKPTGALGDLGQV